MSSMRPECVQGARGAGVHAGLPDKAMDQLFRDMTNRGQTICITIGPANHTDSTYTG
jgi:hypothetical protein